MNLKKSIFSYFIWAAFAVLCCLAMIFALDAARIDELLNWSYVGVAGAVWGYLLLTSLVFFALRTLSMELGEHIREKERLEKVVSVVLPVLILVGAVICLVLYMFYHIPLTLEDNSFYSQALVSAGKNVSFVVHGASWLYPCLLHVMLLIFGNTPFAGVILQIILFFACLLLLYSAVRSFSGVVPAVTSMAVFAFLPGTLGYVFSLTPEFFFLSFYLFGFFLSGMLFQKFKERSRFSSSFYLFTFIAGVYIGFLCYLDLYGISLYLFFAMLYSLDSEKIKPAVKIHLTALLGGMVGFFLFALYASQTGKMSLMEYLKALYTLYAQRTGFDRGTLKDVVLLPDTTLVGSVLLISLAFFVIPAFLIWKRNQNSAFILNLFLVYVLSVFNIFYGDAQMITTLSWVLLAGIGFHGVIRLPEAQTETEGEDAILREEKNSVAAEKKRKLFIKEKTKMSGSEKMKKEEIMKENITTEKKIKRKVQKEMSMEKMIDEGKEQEKPAPGEPLHNPLPIPKKKSHAQADFGFQVKEADMKFDLEVADDDDFDV